MSVVSQLWLPLQSTAKEIMSPGSTVTAAKSFASSAEGIFRWPHPSVAPCASVFGSALVTCNIRHWIPLPPR